MKNIQSSGSKWKRIAGKTFIAIAFSSGLIGAALLGSSGVASAGTNGQILEMVNFADPGSISLIQVTGTNQSGRHVTWYGDQAAVQGRSAETYGWWWAGPVTIKITCVKGTPVTYHFTVPTYYPTDVYAVNTPAT